MMHAIDNIFNKIDNTIIDNIICDDDKSNVLVIGMGGGNDIVITYMIAKHLLNGVQIANCTTI